jgi:deoxyribodipyrimidine photo-lyase
MQNRTGIYWLREDFRLIRNNALSHASQNHEKVSTVYLYKKKLFENRQAQKWWLFKSLENFKSDLDKKNINLEIIDCDSFQAGFKIILKQKNFAIYWNKIYEPGYLNFDQKISKTLATNNIEHKIFKGNLLNEVDEIKKNDGTPFKVFTPFWKTAEKFYLDKGDHAKNIVKPKSSKTIFLKNTTKLSNILPKIKWHPKFEKYWNPSEQESLSKIREFIKNEISEYGSNRDIPGVKGTSKVSPYLAFGQIHVETIWEETQKIEKKSNGYRKYINELGWREFSHSLINYFPQMLKGNLRKEFDRFPWQNNNKLLKLWKKGLTGYPIVDAGMRELCETGWMHNRVRMITASFLVKHLRIHWMEGEKFFRNSLLDFNEANNIAGWQWVAGCGADAAPYFRIFNPILQGEKFDPQGDYVKKWVPELTNVPNKFVHKPWELNISIKEFELGKTYPKPIVVHMEARNEALKAFKTLKALK